MLNDQLEFPRTQPALELLLSSDRLLHILEALKVDEPIDAVSTRESVEVFGRLVLLDSNDEAVPDADVEMMKRICKDVDVVLVVAHGAHVKSSAAAGQNTGILRCAQNDKQLGAGDE